jgi:hypothetical protein
VKLIHASADYKFAGSFNIALQPEADQLDEEEEEGTPCSKQNPHVGTLYYLSL